MSPSERHRSAAIYWPEQQLHPATPPHSRAFRLNTQYRVLLFILNQKDKHYNIRYKPRTFYILGEGGEKKQMTFKKKKKKKVVTLVDKTIL